MFDKNPFWCQYVKFYLRLILLRHFPPPYSADMHIVNDTRTRQMVTTSNNKDVSFA